ncbi:MAG: PPOX class F420-dependent oxidoreductase [Thermomicrobiales bacterium]
MSTISEQYLELLNSTALAHVATKGPQGEPQVNPVWFGWDGKQLRFSQTTTRQKAKNLAQDPRIAVSIVDPENPFRYLEIRGTVVKVEDDPENAFINAMARKYMGVDVYPWHTPGDHRIVMVVEPVHTTHMG